MVLGFGYETGKFILRILYPSIPDDYVYSNGLPLPLIDGPYLGKNLDSSWSSLLYSDE